MDTRKKGFNSKLIHAGQKPDQYGSAVTPIYQTSTFSFENAQQGADRFSGAEKGYIYTRLGNPTITDLEEAVAQLENGFGASAVASGMAAVNLVYMSFLGQGDHVISTGAVYGPSRGVLENIWPKFGVESTFVNTAHLDEVRNAIQKNTKLLYIETPTNPTIELTDIKAISKLAHEHGIVVCVDNTFSSPYLQKPLDLGADVVLHSMTKFINGHADIVGGIVVAKTEELHNIIKPMMTNIGYNMDPHQAYLTRRGLKTLAIRIERAQQNAQKIAEYLEQHPKVEKIVYPGLTSYPQYELAKEQMSGSGAMMSFEIKGGYEAGKKMMDNVHMAMLAVSLGGIETLIQHPASMTHSKLTREARLSAGITDGLVRLAVGIEDVEDLIEDLGQALENC
jgi:methionine-gamma-lyase